MYFAFIRVGSRVRVRYAGDVTSNRFIISMIVIICSRQRPSGVFYDIPRRSGASNRVGVRIIRVRVKWHKMVYVFFFYISVHVYLFMSWD